MKEKITGDERHEQSSETNRDHYGVFSPVNCRVSRHCLCNWLTLCDGWLRRISNDFQALEVGTHLKGGLVAPASVHLGGFFNDGSETLGQFGRGPLNCHAAHRIVNDRRHFIGKGIPTRNHIVEHESKAEEVATSVQILSSLLLGRHEGEGSDPRTWRCE